MDVNAPPHRVRTRFPVVAVVACLVMGALGWGVGVLGRGPATAAAAAGHTPGDASLLAIYVLAFDNAPQAEFAVNLTPKYTDTVQGIISATIGYPNVTAVVLADLDQAADTHVLVVQQGHAATVPGLPDTAGMLDAGLDEYNTADGKTLGGFLRWARQNYPAQRTTFSFIGHGAPLAPRTVPAIADIVTGAARGPADAVPMPFLVDANPDLTDQHAPGLASPQLLTPVDLAAALSAGTSAGADPIDVLDLIHCFAATVEQLYEIAPYADTTVAAPNYAFFDPAMAGAALGDMIFLLADDPATPPAALANSVMGKYFDIIPPNKHPHILVAVDNSLLSPIKAAWDDLSTDLMRSFAQNPAATAVALFDAYMAAATTGTLFDTTFCGRGADYVLGPPDALSDMGQLALAISQQFVTISPTIALDALAANTAVNNAISARSNQNGQPWWDPNPASWTFNGAYGIALFTPFAPMEVDGTLYHAWQALWYTDTQVIAEQVPIGGSLVDVLNPSPYGFIVPQSSGATWADVVAAYWRAWHMDPRQDVATALCLPEIKEIEEADLSVHIVDADPVPAGWTTLVTVTAMNETTLPMTGVVVTATLPAEAVFLSTRAPYCHEQSRVITCHMGDLGSHASASATYRVYVRNVVGPIMHQATVSSTVAERRLDNNTAVEPTDILFSFFSYVPLALDQ